MRKLKILILWVVGFAIATYILGTISWEAEAFKNIIFSHLEERFQKEISADSLKIAFLRNIEVSNLKVSDKKGFSLSAQKVELDYSLPKLLRGGLFARCEARDVRLLRENLAFLKPVFELLLVSYPWGDLRFQNVSTDIHLENNTFIPKNLKAIGQNIKVYGDGGVSADEVIDYKLKFLIASRGTGSTLNIFDIFKELIFPDEESGWISLSFRIKGKKDRLVVFPSGSKAIE